MHAPYPCPFAVCPALPLLAECLRPSGGPLGALPTSLRAPCAPSEEAPLRTGPEDLQGLGSLDTEKRLLCGPGSR